MENIADTRTELHALFQRSDISARMGVRLITGGVLFDKTPYHCHARVRDDYLLLLTLHGAAWVREGDRRRDLRPGDWFLLRPGIPHEYCATAAWSLAYVHMAGEFIKRLLTQLSFFRRENLGFRQNSARAKALLLEIVERGARVTAGAEAMRNALLIQLLTVLHADWWEDRDRSDRLAMVHEHLERHLDGALSLADLATVAGMSRFHFCRTFRAATGMTPMRYVQKRRMEKAGRLLQTPGATVGDTAAAVGFADPLHFSKVFRKWTGMAPTEYRAF